MSPLDDIVGLSVGCRDKEDIIQIWNLDQNHYAEATIFEHIQELVPNVKFSVKFYVNIYMLSNYKLIILTFIS